MEELGEIFGSLSAARLSRRRMIPRQNEEEARIALAPPQAGKENGLSEHIPSSLISVTEQVRALAIGGAPAWSRRLKRIYDLTAATTAQIDHDWHELAKTARGDRARFAAEWQRHVAGVKLEPINELIVRHNRYFPMEANLPMDVKTLDYVNFGGGDYRRPLLDAAWILAQFPPDLAAALGKEPAEPEQSGHGFGWFRTAR
jgi:hypothetical protein